MLPYNEPARKRGLTAIDGALMLMIVLLMVQMWLLVSTLEGYLAGHHDVVVPGAVISGLLFTACGGLLLFVLRLDREAKARRKPPST